MADRNLKSITFPGLPNRYVIPQVEVDSSLTQQGKAADAKVTGDALKAGIAPAYDASSTYAVGEYVMYNNALYRCTTAITTAEAWTAAHWTAAKIGEDLADCSGILYKKQIDGFVNRTDGKYITPGGVTLGNYAAIGVTDLFKTKPGDCWLYNGKLVNGFPYVWGYSDENLNNPVALSPNGPVDSTLVIFIPDGVYYIRAQAITNGATATPFMLLHEDGAIYYAKTSGSFRTFLEAHADKATANNPLKIYIVAYPSPYIFDDEFTEEEKASNTFIGITLPDYVSLEGLPIGTSRTTTLSCTVASSSISTLNLRRNNNLKNLIIKGENCRYPIHDDYNVTFNNRIMENCEVIATNCSYGFAYGGGCRSGGNFYYKDCKFIATNYDGGGYLMHSNTGFIAPAFLKFDNCIFDSQAGHSERAIEIRALGTTEIVNTCILNNCNTNGYKLTATSNIIDWEIIGAGNSLAVPVDSANSSFYLKFFDMPLTETTPSNLGAQKAGVMRFINGAPQWWNGSAWVDATGTVVT